MCTCEKEKQTNKQQSNDKLGDDLIKLLKYLASAALLDTSSTYVDTSFTYPVKPNIFLKLFKILLP